MSNVLDHKHLTCPYCYNSDQSLITFGLNEEASTFGQVYDQIGCEKCGKLWFHVYEFDHEEDASGERIVR